MVTILQTITEISKQTQTFDGAYVHVTECLHRLHFSERLNDYEKKKKNDLMTDGLS